MTAYRFTSGGYGAELAIGTVLPRISLRQFWTLGVEKDIQRLEGRLDYTVDRAGIFSTTFLMPEPWEIVSVGPGKLVDDHEFSGSGAERKMTVTLNARRPGRSA